MLSLNGEILSNTFVKIEKNNEFYYLPANKLDINFVTSLSISEEVRNNKFFICPKCKTGQFEEGLCWDCKCKDLYLTEEEEINRVKNEIKKQKIIEEINSGIYNFKFAELILPIIYKNNQNI